MTDFHYALSLGSNLGDREKNLWHAIHALTEIDKKIRFSSIFETVPMYVDDQPMFLNMSATVVCTQAPLVFLQYLKALEQELGRVDGFRHGPRVVDIDIILCGQLTMDIEGLTIPHCAFQERDFVLRPLAEIAADWIDPRSGKTVATLSDAVQSDTVCRYVVQCGEMASDKEYAL